MILETLWKFFFDKYIQRFSELHEKASTCNNVATLQNIKVEADAQKVKKPRTVSIRYINTDIIWQLETSAGVTRYIEELEKKLMAQLEDDTIIHVEF